MQTVGRNHDPATVALQTAAELSAAMPAGGRIVPQIDRVVGLDGVAAGLAEIGSAHARAKIVVRPA